jgi:hypothetical protein
MKTLVTIASRTAGALAIVAIALGGPVGAEGSNFQPVKDATVLKECGACHMPYLAGLLPARSWTAIMAGLKDHFGENAELDASTAARITAYLTANAADSRGVRFQAPRGQQQTTAPLRITELSWWLRKHDKKSRVSPATMKRRGAKLKSDCVACHVDAARGSFDDD